MQRSSKDYTEQRVRSLEWSIYIGTYTTSGSEGIYHGRFSTETGEITELRLAARADHPSYLTIHPNGKWLYAVSEVDRVGDEPGGEVIAYRIDSESGALTPINRRSTRGSYPCHVSIEAPSRNLMVANYGGGSVTMIPLGDDGSLLEVSSFHQHRGKSVNPKRQEGPHAHSIVSDPHGRYVYAADLGLDQILIYRIDAASRQLLPGDPSFASTPPGSGPRHIAFHPNGRLLYCVGELDSTVLTYAIDQDDGGLTKIDVQPALPAEFAGDNTGADIHVHPNGRFLYYSNRGHDSIAIFHIDEETGRLTPIGHASTLGKTPRNFTIDPSGRFLLVANQNSDHIVTFSIDEESGQLKATGAHALLSRPVCVVFCPQAN